MVSRTLFKGWRVTVALGAVVAALSVPILALQGVDENSLHLFLRTTARCSTILFLIAFTASSLVRLRPNDWTRWLAQNRRYIGVSFAFSHTLHLIGILLLMRMKPGDFTSTDGLVTMVGGGAAFVLLYLMTATSFDRTAAWIGARAWRLIHKTGMYYFFFIFALDYVGLALDSPRYIPFAVLVMGSLFLRILAWRKKRKQAALAYS